MLAALCQNGDMSLPTPPPQLADVSNLKPDAGISPSLTGFGLGFSAALTGLGLLLKSPRRLLMCALPLLLGIALTLAATVGFAVMAPTLWKWLLSHFSHAGGAGIGVGEKLVVGLLAVALLAVAGYTLLLAVIVIVSAPVANLLAAQAEEECGGDPAPKLTLAEELVDVVRGLFQGIARLGVYLAVTAGLALVVFVLPPLIVVAVPLSIAAAGAFLVYDLMDPSMSRRQMDFGDKWRLMQTHKSACLGLAVVSLLIMSIPLVNVVLAPGLTMGGAVLYVRLTAVRSI